jgi:RNA polymerase sigma-70 factor (ECF subfamily)
MAADPLVDLMGRYCDGDAAAFREIYALVAPRLLHYLLRMVRDRAVAEDLLQQTFLKVHKARGAYVRGAAPLPWLYAIAHRTCLDEIRRRQRSHVNVAADGDAPLEGRAELDGAEEGSSPSNGDPELARAALAALDDLPPNQREALVLTKLDGHSIAEAAQITGTTPGAIKLRVHRGYETLRRALGRVRGDARGDS